MDLAVRHDQAIRGRVEIGEGSHGDAAVVDRAFAGAGAVFWVAPPAPSETLDDTYVNFTQPAVGAIRRHGVAHVVAVTALGQYGAALLGPHRPYYLPPMGRAGA